MKKIISSYENEFNIKDKILEFKNILDNHKQIHLGILTLFKGEQKIAYIDSITESYIDNIFSNKKTIKEAYKNMSHKSFINEQVLTINERLNQLNEFLVGSLIYETGLLLEYSWGEFWGDVKNVGSKVIQGAKSIVQGAVNFLNSKGVSFVFETIRKFLFSGWGVAAQISLAFIPGVGAVANDIVWGILALYDAYQYFKNNAPGSLTNLIIDIFCLATGGLLSKYLGKFAGRLGKSAKDIIKFLIEGAPGVSKWFQPILAGLGKFINVIMKAADWAYKTLGIKWFSEILGSLKRFVGELTGIISKPLSVGAATAFKKGLTWVELQSAGKLTQVLGPKLETQVFDELLKMSPNKIAVYLNKPMRDGVVKAAKSEFEKHLKERPTAYALAQLDKILGGTDFSTLYTTYVDAEKKAKKGSLDQGVSKVLTRQVKNTSQSLAYGGKDVLKQQGGFEVPEFSRENTKKL